MIFKVTDGYHLILASSSPRRRDILKQCGLDFEVIVSGVEEAVPGHMDPGEAVKRLALAKASAVAEAHRSSWIVGADTMVVVDGEALGKPGGFNEATTMIKKLQGKTHQVVGGFCVVNVAAGVKYADSCISDVEFVPMSDRVIESYIGLEKPYDKAGGYGIQEGAGIFVKRISGSYLNVVGLPAAQLLSLLLDFGVICPSTRKTER